MTYENSRRRYGVWALLFGLAGTIVYLVMINITLAHLETLSGQIPFDMRPMGYDPIAADRLLAALGAEGRDYYLKRQIPLDTIYPPLLALTLVCTLGWLGKKMPNSKVISLGVIAAWSAAAADYVENIGISLMLRTWPQTSEVLVYGASAASILKASLTTCAVLITLSVALMSLLNARKDQGKVVRH